MSPTFKHLLEVHPVAFALGNAAWAASFVGVILLLPDVLALIASIAVTLGHTVGAATWILWRFHYGYQAGKSSLCRAPRSLWASASTTAGERRRVNRIVFSDCRWHFGGRLPWCWSAWRSICFCGRGRPDLDGGNGTRDELCSESNGGPARSTDDRECRAVENWRSQGGRRRDSDRLRDRSSAAASRRAAHSPKSAWLVWDESSLYPAHRSCGLVRRSQSGPIPLSPAAWPRSMPAGRCSTRVLRNGFRTDASGGGQGSAVRQDRSSRATGGGCRRARDAQDARRTTYCGRSPRPAASRSSG